EIVFSAAWQQGNFAAFFQQSFEWEQMTYVFYPYFWGRQAKWAEHLTADAGDELFGRFLKAGFARLIVPVRQGHNDDILNYLETGVPWSGTEPPILGDERYLSIIEEIKETLDAPDSGKPEGTSWEFKVPTSLVMLDNDVGKLPEWPKKRIPP